ncbi:MAG: diguanylate cyclase [Aliidiomarina sp.]|uniref:diguanylate cyclase domain-containing protein n=1 Tax=Aliidiomarina sp. TaxID=1872439 RepID=UPI0025B836DB|nr:diguanylate cyclase [Aliidiomarina sp.]MCH8502216.1 diguanylate cyclase [Aliidiomarina sp.]
MQHNLRCLWSLVLLFMVVLQSPAWAQSAGAQICVAADVNANEQTLSQLVIAVPNEAVRLRLQRAYPEYTLRVVSDQIQRNGQSTSFLTAIQSKQVLAWWCGSDLEDALHAELQVIPQQSIHLLRTVQLDQTLDLDFISESEQAINLRPSEFEAVLSAGVLYIGLPEDSSPISFRDRSERAVGLDVDVMQLLSERIGFSYEWVDCGTWNQCVRALEQRDIDVLSFMTPTSERLNYAAFSVPYWDVAWATVSLESNPVRGQNFNSLRTKVIAVVENYSILDQIKAIPGMTILLVETPEDGLSAVLNGVADAYLDSLPLLMNRVREQGLTGMVLNILRDEPGDQVSIGVHRDFADLVPIIDRAILSVSAAERQAIQEAWFDPSLESGLNREQVQRWAIIMTILVIVIITLFVARMFVLRKHIRRQKQREAKIRHQALHDSLTALPNRAHILERVNDVLTKHLLDDKKFALLFIDLDGFKAINDERGHEAGDELLIAVAKRLQHSVRESDLVGRYGGDEFVILLTDLTATDQATVVAEKILSRMGQPFRIDSGLAQIGASIGVAMFPDHGDDLESLLSAADEAMYKVKESGKHGIFLAKPAVPAE